MLRIKFREGEQRKFMQEVMKKINCPSLRELINRGIDVNYSTLKNYYAEERTLPESFFNDLCYISKINKEELNIQILKENWGQTKGGKISKRN